jgi:hypothetical protein
LERPEEAARWMPSRFEKSAIEPERILEPMAFKKSMEGVGTLVAAE